jgi:hypothetical protein
LSDPTYTPAEVEAFRHKLAADAPAMATADLYAFAEFGLQRLAELNANEADPFNETPVVETMVKLAHAELARRGLTPVAPTEQPPTAQ